MSGGGGSSGPTSSTTQTSNIPDWMRPQVETALGAATQQIFNVEPSGQITASFTQKNFDAIGIAVAIYQIGFEQRAQNNIGTIFKIHLVIHFFIEYLNG